MGWHSPLWNYRVLIFAGNFYAERFQDEILKPTYVQFFGAFRDLTSLSDVNALIAKNTNLRNKSKVFTPLADCL